MPNILGHKGNANQNDIEISFQSEWLSSIIQAIANAVKDAGDKGNLIHCWWEYKLVQLLWKAVYKGSSKN
jgi:hypothetical protein